MDRSDKGRKNSGPQPPTIKTEVPDDKTGKSEKRSKEDQRANIDDSKTRKRSSDTSLTHRDTKWIPKPSCSYPSTDYDGFDIVQTLHLMSKDLEDQIGFYAPLARSYLRQVSKMHTSSFFSSTNSYLNG